MGNNNEELMDELIEAQEQLSSAQRDLVEARSWQIPVIEELSSDGKVLTIRGIALGEGIFNGYFYPKKELEKGAPTLVHTPLVVDHEKGIKDMVGEVTKAWWDAQLEVIRFEAEVIDKQVSVLIKRSLVDSVSVGSNFEPVETVHGMTVSDIMFYELSLTTRPAFKDGIKEALKNKEENKEQEKIDKGLKVKTEDPKFMLVYVPTSELKDVTRKYKSSYADYPTQIYRNTSVENELSVPFHGVQPIADENLRFPTTFGDERLQFSDISFAWIDPRYSELKNDNLRLLPHHLEVDGELKVVWRGVSAAMAVANDGAMGGLDVPEDNRRAVYEHLAAHYRQFGKEVPQYNAELGDKQPLNTIKDTKKEGDNLADEEKSEQKPVEETATVPNPSEEATPSETKEETPAESSAEAPKEESAPAEEKAEPKETPNREITVEEIKGLKEAIVDGVSAGIVAADKAKADALVKEEAEKPQEEKPKEEAEEKVEEKAPEPEPEPVKPVEPPVEEKKEEVPPAEEKPEEKAEPEAEKPAEGTTTEDAPKETNIVPIEGVPADLINEDAASLLVKRQKAIHGRRKVR